MIRLAVRCAPEYAEHVMANMLELAPNGLEEERGPGWVEFAIYGPPGEVPEIGELRAAAGGSLVDVTTTSVPDDWADRWADFHRPIEVAGRIGVRPSWWDPKEGLIDVVVDPGRAFGTGGHPTTRLCLDLLVELEEAGEATGPIADWGTGSGVLAIAAAKLGWSPVTGCDRELAALETARANAEVNDVEMEIERVDVREEAPPVARTVVANLTGNLLQDCARHLADGGDRPATLVCSGMLESELDEVSSAFAGTGLGENRRRTEHGWGALLLRPDA
ncbi:MAG TPA: 50S ribosomal protein L11 methyltransferase [Solirubrobacterales bacterium]|jgi:ribosomal protein L11 methyltransferase